ncbi:MAG: hypothetical protein M1370_05385 [Bacteroidetes bacterium]|nr:hypothetical protein [Bacteroidota bacterium]MCL5026965.1 hypothetical protein [Chloroflexota bacterium]
MEQLLLLVVLIALGALAYYLLKMRQAGRPKEDLGPVSKTVADLEPGDGIAFWDGENCLVDNVLRCSEEVGSRKTGWQWALLSNGRLIEVAPDGNSIYDRPEVLHQGSAAFEELTGDEGILKTFEQRVREGVSGSQPVYYNHGGTDFRVKSTGTFTANVSGKPLTQEVWRDISSNAGDNVYFEMESDAGQMALGIWTSHIAWHVGQPLKESDIDSIYPMQKGGSNR